MECGVVTLASQTAHNLQTHIHVQSLCTDGKLQTKHQKCQYIINLFANKLLEYVCAARVRRVAHKTAQTIHIQTICFVR